MMKLKMFLNGKIAGTQAFIFLAKARGWLAEEGIELECVEALGSAIIVDRMETEDVDIAYGDMTALMSAFNRIGEAAPIAVWAMFDTCPFTIAVRADGPIASPRDFAGHTLISNPFDAALRAFPVLAMRTGLDPATVTIQGSHQGHRAHIEQMLAGGAHEGVFGFENTIIADIAPSPTATPEQLRFINYADWASELYANAIIVSRRLVREHPEIVRGLLRAFNRGLVATLEDVDAGLAAVRIEIPDMDMAVHKRRLLGTLRLEMANPEGARLGIGDFDDDRLQRSIELVGAAMGVSTLPAISDIFNRSFLPPLSERVTSLARPDRPAVEHSHA